MDAPVSLEGRVQASEVELIVRQQHAPLIRRLEKLVFVLVALRTSLLHCYDIKALRSEEFGETLIDALVQVDGRRRHQLSAS
jgi:hypothetical protein